MHTNAQATPSRLAAALLALVLGVAIAACGGDSDSSESAEAGSSGGGLLDDPKLPPAPADAEGADVNAAQQLLVDSTKPVKFTAPGPSFDISDVDKPVWLITVPSTFQAVPAINQGFLDAGEAAGVPVHICEGEGEPDKIAICLEQAAEAGAGSVIDLGIDPALLAKPLAEAQDAGLKIATANSALRIGEPLPPNVNGQVSHDYYGAGVLGAAYAVAERGGAVNALCIEVPEFPVTDSVCKGFSATVEKFCPDCAVTTKEVHIADMETQTGAIVNQEVLQNQDLNFIMGSLDDLAPLIGPTLKRLGKTPDDVTVGGQNGTLGALEAIRDGSDYQKVSAGQHNIWWGWAVFDIGARVQVEDLPKTGQTEPNVPFTRETFDYDGEIDLESADAIYGYDDGAIYKEGYEASWTGP